MKLIGCYIENFGGLNKYSLDFQDGLTVIQAPNGFGKTTLAEFIRAMFYGFPRKTRTLGRRQKYRPWNGKKCCGHLTFEHEGKQYRIERTFGATPRGDSFALIDLQTGQKSTRFSEEIGVELFGLDADSFERSTYLPQHPEAGPLTTDSIRAKLGDLVEDSSDVGNFEKAMNTLRGKRSGYIPYRGSGGAVAEDAAMITRLQQELDRAAASENALAQTTEAIAALEAEQVKVNTAVAAIRADITAANEAAARMAHRQHYNGLAAELARADGELEELAKRYPRGLPDGEALDAVSAAVDRAAQLAAAQVVTSEDQRAQRFMEENQRRFAAGVPGDGEFESLRRVCDDCRAVAAQLEACSFPAEEAAELEKLKAFFAPGVPEKETLPRWEADLEEAGRLRQENTRLAARTVEAVSYKVPSPLTVPILLGIGGVSAVAGIVLLARSVFAPGGVALALGILALLAAGYLSLRTGMARQTAGLSPQIQALMRENEARAAALEAAVQAGLAPYGGRSAPEIRRWTERLEVLTQRDSQLAEKRRTLEVRRVELDRVLREFFRTYCPDTAGGAYELLARVQRDCDTWNRARKQLADRDERLALHRRASEEVQNTLEAFREKYGIALRSRSQVLALRDDIRRTAELARAAASMTAQMEEYRQAHGDVLEEPAETMKGDPALLRSREKQLQLRQDQIVENLLRDRQRARQLRGEADRIPELRDELARWQEKKQADQDSARLLDDTMDFLARAKDDLATAYMGPIRESFTALMARMTGEEAGSILMTPELEVKLDRAGESRELAYFSAGQTDLIMLCMRLALVDALFREAKPFVILDDPFVNLDDERTREALALLRDLSRDRQILYLVCHSSRV